MNREHFDALTKLVSTASSRRTALGALLGLAAAGPASLATAKPNGKAKRKRTKGNAGTREPVAAEASCASPGPSRNMNGCNFNGDDFSGGNLSSSKMVETTFRNARLVRTNLSSSNMKQGDFRRANLCGANLRSSTLKDADFQNADLTHATLKSSGCSGLRTNAGTVFCNTTMCNGSVRNDDCPTGVDPRDVCCSDDECPPEQHCVDGVCQAPCGGCPAGAGCVDGTCVCLPGTVELPDGNCAWSCADNGGCQAGSLPCTCLTPANICVNLDARGNSCTNDPADCPPGMGCVGNRCIQLCGFPAV